MYLPNAGEVSRVREQSARPTNPSTADLARDVTTALAGLNVWGLVVGVNPRGEVTLDGAVPSEKARTDAEQLANVPGARAVVNRLRVDPNLVLERALGEGDTAESTGLIAADQDQIVTGTEIDLNEPIGTTDTAISTEEAEPFFAPTDPPTRSASRDVGGYEVVDGFAGTSQDAPIDPEQLPPELLTGDDEIGREVRLALLDDAATADLSIRVYVRQGVVVLRGTVGSLDDAELAVAVASEVPGVIDVVDETEVSGL
jgi:osmotically-inducible protein OsmY